MYVCMQIVKPIISALFSPQLRITLLLYVFIFFFPLGDIYKAKVWPDEEGV